MKSWRIILICILMIYGPLAWAANLDEPAAEAVQEYEIAGYRLRVPIGYLRNSELPASDRVRVKMFASQQAHFGLMYPDLAPIPYDLRPRLATHPAPKAYTRFVIEAVPGLLEPGRSRRMAKMMREGSCDASQAGDVCAHPYAVQDNFESIYMGYGSEFTFCNKTNAVPVPHCRTRQVLADGLMISTYFDLDFLEFENPPWERIYALVCSWIDLPADRSLTINRCRDLAEAR